jgi:hypothetical protein
MSIECASGPVLVHVNTDLGLLCIGGHELLKAQLLGQNSDIVLMGHDL